MSPLSENALGRMHTIALSLRLATMDDAAFLLRLRTDPATVAASRQQRRVEEAEHLAWLTATLDDPAKALYIAVMGPLLVGTARLDHWECPDACATELSLTVAPPSRGRGFARQILLSAMETDPYRCRRWIAEVRRENIPSLWAFLSVGWLIDGYRAGGFVTMEYERAPEPAPVHEVDVSASGSLGLSAGLS